VTDTATRTLALADLPRRRPSGLKAANLALAVAVPVAVVVWWWVASASARPVDLPSPALVFQKVIDLLVGQQAFQTWTSFGRIIAAVLIALVAGAALVFLTRLLPVTETLVGSVVLTFLNGVPALGWAILGVIWFGVGNFAVIFVVTLILMPFCMVNLWEGMRSLDPGLLEMGRSFTRSSMRVLTRIQIPLLMPYTVAAVRLSFSVGWKVALIAEFFGAEAGLGLVMNRARQAFDTSTVFACIIVVLLVVIVAERAVFDPLSRYLAKRSGTGAAR
jgi:NitT/TauT family transport system permease protein/sulfonate transport system permease protein